MEDVRNKLSSSGFGSRIEVKAHPLVTQSYAPIAAIERENRNEIASIAESIDCSQKTILVGHSSGSAMALEVGKKLKGKKGCNLENINVVSLDGFSLDLSGVQTRCWTIRQDPKERDSSVFYGFNHKYMTTSCGPRCNGSKQARCYHEYVDPGKEAPCTRNDAGESLCLHMRMINLKAPPNTNLVNAYQNLQINTKWLEEFVSSVEAD
ncbi:MAG: hypothetical protein AB7O96_17820 [Pseudobdellovibrionaceae bacterium]